jgi:hypothetical protein
MDVCTHRLGLHRRKARKLYISKWPSRHEFLELFLLLWEKEREKKLSDIQVRQCNVQIRRNQTSKNANQVAVEPELQILSLSEKEKLD